MSIDPLVGGTGVLSIAQRFCGPKNSGNGGYVAGLLGKVINGPAEVRLRSMPPLERSLTIESDGQEAVLRDGETVVATARTTSLDVAVPDLPPLDALDQAQAAFAAMPLILPYCFVCGRKREPGDGLRIFSGPIEGTSVNADLWVPDESLTDEDGLVATEFLWAALDCPSAYGLRLADGFVLLGSLSVEIRRRPRPGEQLMAMGWAGEADGRKYCAHSALVTLNDEAIAVSKSVWINLNDEALISALKEQNQ
ncbi:MAG: hypothetical protein AAF608_10005 [Pseudomonadota bacterium]